VLVGAAILPLALVANGPAAAETATRLDPVTSVATKTERSRDDLPSSVDVVDLEEIQRRAPTKVDDLIRDLPGVDMSGGPRRMGLDVNIRGFGGQRVVTTIDGVRQNFDAGHKGRIFVEPDLLKQVEVLKGPASALHGSGAVGGVLALTTVDASDLLEAGEQYGLRGKFGYSSAAREPLIGVTHFGRPAPEFEYLANGSYRRGGTIKQGGDKELANSATDLKSALVKAAATPAPNHRIGATHRFVSETGGVPNIADSAVSVDAPLVHRRAEQVSTSLNYGYRTPGGGPINPNVLLYRNTYHVTDDRLPPLTTRSDVSDLETLGFDLYNTSQINTGFGGHAVTVGTEYYTDDQSGSRNGAPRPQFPTATQDVFGAYLQDEMTFGPVSITPGLRFDTYSREAAGTPDSSESKVSPRAGAIWRVTPWASLFGSYAQGFRAPSLTELFIAGAHIPGLVTFVSNPNLEPEKTETFEGGMRFKFDNVIADRDRLRISGSYYRTTAEDFIELFISGLTPGSTATYRNIPDATVDGAELEISYDAIYAFAQAGLSRIRGENDGTGQPINSIPPDKLTLSAGGKAPAYDIIAGVRSEIVDAQDRVATDGTRTGGYAVHGIFASWVPEAGLFRGTRVDLGIANILDKSYRRHLSLLNDEGRDYYGTVSYTLKF
jgi:hemoglobin/transferrin/lactoferrin receptor protein